MLNHPGAVPVRNHHATLASRLNLQIEDSQEMEDKWMSTLMKFPLLVFVLSFCVLWLSVRIGDSFRKKGQKLEDDAREDLGVILAATLTLLGLIIGFSFSMAISRYDQRKNFEEEEANAIGTEYLRADLLPVADAQRIRTLLASYHEQRISFYKTRDQQRLDRVNADTAQLQAELWSAVRGPATAQPSPVTALVVSGMTDVLNTQGYTQAAWWNRIPASAWGLMIAIAIFSSLLLGYSLRRAESNSVLLLVLPLVVSISFFLIADIDSPRRGIIRVIPENLVSLSQSLHPL